MLAAHASGAHRIAGSALATNAGGMSAEMRVMQQAWLQLHGPYPRIRLDDLASAVGSSSGSDPGGQFLDDDLTVELMRSDEFFRHDVFDPAATRRQPADAGAAHERVERLGPAINPGCRGHSGKGLRRFFQ